MKVVDELFTPGCPQCAVKHLSAALYHVAKAGGHCEPLAADPYMVEVCIAYINLVEVRAGYLSHFWYAVGALVRAEERMAPRMVGECVAREVRLMLEQYGVEVLIDALKAIDEGTAPNHADWAVAHFSEAMRELPAMADGMRMDDLVGSIERIRKEYFDLPEAGVAEGETTTNQGEPEMATKNKAACKGGSCSPKGKCAEKGGTTAKGAKVAKVAAKTVKAGAKGGKGKK